MAPLFVTYLRRKSLQNGGVQMLPNLLMWAFFLVYVLLFYLYLIAFGIHRVNRYRFRNCPWIIKAQTRYDCSQLEFLCECTNNYEIHVQNCNYYRLITYVELFLTGLLTAKT